jgi:hypothetical protein
MSTSLVLCLPNDKTNEVASGGESMWSPVAPLPFTEAHRRTQERWLRAQGTLQQVALRARIILMAADGGPVQRRRHGSAERDGSRTRRES